MKDSIGSGKGSQHISHLIQDKTINGQQLQKNCLSYDKQKVMIKAR